MLMSLWKSSLKGLRPLPPAPAVFRMFGFLDFLKKAVFQDFRLGFGVWGGSESTGNSEIRSVGIWGLGGSGGIFKTFNAF